MALECIHGLDGTQCDSCFPKKAPEKPVVAPRRTATRSIKGSTGAPSVQQANVATQRVYHLTHSNNLAAIIEAGELRADATPVVDISSELTRDLRRTAEVSPGTSVADHVPFFLSPDAALWNDLRLGIYGPHWSAAARTAALTDFVMLVSDLGSLGTDAVLTDSDAAGSLTRFAPMSDTGERMLRRLHTEDDTLLDAEVLSPAAVPLTAISLIGVPNDRARDTVRGLLKSSQFGPKVAVYPPWFQPTVVE